MTVLDPGHLYALAHLDGNLKELLRFVKREGDKYPGNEGSYPGTNMQEVLRALIDRIQYVDKQDPCDENIGVLQCFREAITLLEKRAARRSKRGMLAIRLAAIDGIEKAPFCNQCGHVGCRGLCRIPL